MPTLCVVIGSAVILNPEERKSRDQGNQHHRDEQMGNHVGNPQLHFHEEGLGEVDNFHTVKDSKAGGNPQGGGIEKGPEENADASGVFGLINIQEANTMEAERDSKENKPG